MKIERILYGVLVLGMVILSPFAFRLSPLSAQNMTSSPFSRYAYGDLNENVPTGYRAMGGVGFGMRNNRAINPSQPASYTSCDTLTFMFDLAASANWSRYRDAGGMKNKANGNLEYVTMQFPLYKRWIAMSTAPAAISAPGWTSRLPAKWSSTSSMNQSRPSPIPGTPAVSPCRARCAAAMPRRPSSRS